MKSKIILALLFFSCSYWNLSGQKKESTIIKKLNAAIEHKYKTYSSPFQISYTVYPYGGSGSYEYKWRLKGELDAKYSAQTDYNLSYECEQGKRPEITIFCEVKDKDTGETFIVKKIHPVEFCIINEQ